MKCTISKFSRILLVVLLAMGIAAGTASAAGSGTDPLYKPDDLFTDRDLVQTADVSEAEFITVGSGSDVRITSEGVYVLSGSASGTTVYVDAGEKDKVQLVLDGLNITNTDFPCIYVVSADKAFITVSGDSSLSVTGTFRADGSTKTDGVVFSKADLVLNGTASLGVSSSGNGIVCKDDLKITGGTYDIQAASKAVDANDSIRIAGGTFTLAAGTDGLHAENGDDTSLGYIYIGGGTFDIRAGDDGVHAVSALQIDGGSLNIRAKEGLESTVIQINGGSVRIESSDDGINAAWKNRSVTPAVIFNGGEVSVTMSGGDTDGVDSNGNIYVNGGTVSVTGNSSFDYDGVAEMNGGTVIVNGQQVSSLPNQFMGGRGGWGGQGGGQDSWGGQGGGRGGRGGGRR